MSSVVLLGGIPTHKDLAPSIVFVVLVSASRALPRPQPDPTEADPLRPPVARSTPSPSRFTSGGSTAPIRARSCSFGRASSSSPGWLSSSCAPSWRKATTASASSVRRRLTLGPSLPSADCRPLAHLASRRTHPPHDRLRPAHRPAHRRLGLARLPLDGRRPRRRRRRARYQAPPVAPQQSRDGHAARHRDHHRERQCDRRAVEPGHGRPGRRRGKGDEGPAHRQLRPGNRCVGALVGHAPAQAPLLRAQATDAH